MAPLNEVSDDALSPEDLIARGRREMLCSQIPSAVECFQRACHLLSEKNGDLHEELAIPNLLYGAALLELSRSENHILGESVEIQADNQPSSDEDEKPKEQPEVGEQSQSTSNANVGSCDGEFDKSANNGNNEMSNQSGESNDVEYDVDEMGDENVSTLQLAWEVVEVAKKIFMRNDDAQHRLKVSDCLEKLAEIGQEVGNYEQALSDLLECLEIRLKYAPDNDRLIAETHFQLAIAYSHVGNTASSDKSFRETLSFLNKCKSKLELRLGAMNGEAESDRRATDDIQLQVNEITGLINEVMERRKENSTTVQVVKHSDAEFKSLDTPVDDISHLIKRKKPRSEDECEISKKLRKECEVVASEGENSS